jgi:hypothetical protein
MCPVQIISYFIYLDYYKLRVVCSWVVVWADASNPQIFCWMSRENETFSLLTDAAWSDPIVESHTVLEWKKPLEKVLPDQVWVTWKGYWGESWYCHRLCCVCPGHLKIWLRNLTRALHVMVTPFMGVWKRVSTWPWRSVWHSQWHIMKWQL